MLTRKHYSQPGCCCCCVSSSFLYFYSCRSTMMLEMNFQLMLNKLSWLRIFSCLNILGFSFLLLPSSHQSISTCSMFLVTRNNEITHYKITDPINQQLNKADERWSLVVSMFDAAFISLLFFYPVWCSSRCVLISLKYLKASSSSACFK